MTDRTVSDAAHAFRQRLAAWGTTMAPAVPAEVPTALPVGGLLAGVHPLDVEGGLALSSAMFKRRLKAMGEGRDVALYRSPFDPA
ncbi:MAG: hypothetical protein Q7V15_02135 [Phenylobacterium sp.]|uniref:hypothetical protein n=1 Tax=Phenylobacterium sp. TaxID=1871053 RepID=UPI0027163B19|nr:hypothetical protein [Phenylobacterium sp.]MDO8900133.1 hypothetical protein [Phenylobacterium sp.]